MTTPHYLFEATFELDSVSGGIEVTVTEHPDRDAAKAYFARVLAGDELELAP